MLDSFIKYSFLMFFSFYTYYKLLNLKLRSKYYLLIYLPSSLVCSGCIVYSNYTSPYIGFFLMIIIIMIITTLLTKTEFRISVISGMLAYGISNVIFIVSLFIISSILYILAFDYLSYTLILVIGTVFLETIFLILLFRMKRLRNGMPFLTDRGADNIGTTISLLALCSMALLLNNDGRSYIYILPISIVFVCGVYIIIWWHKWLTKTYLSRKREQEELEMIKTLEEKDIYIEKLKQQNRALGKLIHQDNKLIPAMEMAVIKLLKSQINNESTEITETAHKLLEDLKSLSNSRKGILSEIEIEAKQLPATGISSLDSLFTYLSAKAARAKVATDLTVHGDLKYFIQTVINEGDLNTLLAEIIDNSIHSASHGTTKRILISIDLIENQYVFQIYDSGDYFDYDVLRYFGLKQITTHKNDGGSGIGLLNIYEIINKYKASIILDETLPSTGIYTKKTSVYFDHKNEYILKSNRTDKTGTLSAREDLIVIKGDNTPK